MPRPQPEPRVFITRQLLPEALELVGAAAATEVWPDEQPPTPEELAQKVAGVDGVLTNIMDRVDAAFFDAAPGLRVVSQLSVGLDNVDLAEATRRGVLVGYTPGILARSTADLTFALLMAAARRVSESDRWVRGGNWKLAHHPLHWLGTEVHGATLGIVGLGQIGLEVAKRARGFDMKLLYYSRNRKPDLVDSYGLEYAGLPTLPSSADFVTLHLPLTPETRHFIGATELRMMRSTAVLVNASRGPVVDAGALYTALKEGWIYAAGLDVSDPEPIPAGDPLLTLDNVVITPHIGSAAVGTRRATMLLAARNLLAGLKGERLEACANPEVYPSLGI